MFTPYSHGGSRLVAGLLFIGRFCLVFLNRHTDEQSFSVAVLVLALVISAAHISMTGFILYVYIYANTSPCCAILNALPDGSECLVQ